MEEETKAEADPDPNANPRFTCELPCELLMFVLKYKTWGNYWSPVLKYKAWANYEWEKSNGLS